jgi:molecular chaperone DnaJ
MTIQQVRVVTEVACEACGATGATPGTATERCDGCDGSGQVPAGGTAPGGSAARTLACLRCGGLGSVVSKPCPACDGGGRCASERIVRLKVPGGLRDGTRIRLAGQGQAGARGGRPGDLYITLTLRDAPGSRGAPA